MKKEEMIKIFIEQADKLPPEFRGSINSEVVDPILGGSKIEPEDLMGDPYLTEEGGEIMNPQDYKRRSPLVKWEVRKFRTSPLPISRKIFIGQEIPAADPSVEKSMLDFLKPKPPIIRGVFSGWWVK